MIATIRRPFGLIWKSLFAGYEHQYEFYLNKEIAHQCDSLLDVGCGFNSPVQHLVPRPGYLVGVDAFEPAIDHSRSLGLHDEYCISDVLEIGKHYLPCSFDCVLASDLIEHLSIENGYRLVNLMETIARKKVIIYTPNGFLEQGEYYDNPFQKHLSGWSVRQMQHLGFRVIGIQGLKPLRGETARIKWWPTRFWSAISLLSQPLTTRWPQVAFRILCIKDVSGRPGNGTTSSQELRIEV